MHVYHLSAQNNLKLSFQAANNNNFCGGIK